MKKYNHALFAMMLALAADTALADHGDNQYEDRYVDDGFTQQWGPSSNYHAYQRRMMSMGRSAENDAVYADDGFTQQWGPASAYHYPPWMRMELPDPAIYPDGNHFVDFDS